MTEHPQGLRQHLFLSDLHLNSAALYARQMSWFKPEQHLPRQLTLLRDALLPQAHHIEQLVFLGDTFDTWLGPMDELPPTYAEIIDSNPEIFDALNSLIERGVRLIFVPGNHDFDLQQEHLLDALPGAIVQDELCLGRDVIAQHGHEKTFFNTRDFDPDQGRPMGYFLSRLAADRLLHGHSHSPRAVYDYVRQGALSSIHRPDAAGRILEAFFYRFSGLKPHDEFILEDGRPWRADAIIEHYRFALQALPVPERLWRLSQRPLNLTGAAKRIAHERHRRLVLLGHCHHSLHRQLSTRATYINAGSWCERDAAVAKLMIDAQGRLKRAQLMILGPQGQLTPKPRATRATRRAKP